MNDKILITYASRTGTPADGLKFTISVRTAVWKEGDHRDWEEIRKWNESLKENL